MPKTEGPVSVSRLALHLDLDAPPAASRPQRLPRRGRVDLNRASQEDLVALPGIGPALAARIESAREKRPFTSTEDLLGVPGIGPATLERLRRRTPGLFLAGNFQHGIAFGKAALQGWEAGQSAGLALRPEGGRR